MKLPRSASLPVLCLIFTFSARAQITLAANNLTEGPTAGSDAVLVYAASVPPYSYTISDSWLTLNTDASAKGITFSSSNSLIGFQNGPNRLKFSFTANTGSTRTATIAFGGMTLTVTQAGSAFLPAGLVNLIPAGAGLYAPMGLAVDQSGNLFIGDGKSYDVKKWDASTQQVSEVFNAGGLPAVDLAFDQTGNLFILEYDPAGFQNRVLEKLVSSQTTEIYNSPYGTAALPANRSLAFCVDPRNSKVYLAEPSTSNSCVVDVFGNVYEEDDPELNIGLFHGPELFTLPHSAAAGGVYTGALLGETYGLSMDNGSYLYFLDNYGTRLRKVDPYLPLPLDSQIATLVPKVATGAYTAIDSNRTIYISESPFSRVQAVPNAYVNATPFEFGYAGCSGSVQILPASQNMTGAYAPLSSAAWLTTSVANGVVQFTCSANPGPHRYAGIRILGVLVVVDQDANPAPLSLGIAAGNNQTSAAGQPFATNPAAYVLANGLPLAGAQVQFSSPGVLFAGKGTTAVVTTDANGLATAPPMSPLQAGPIALTVSLVNSNLSQTFSGLTATPNGISAVAGGGQFVLAGQPLATNLKVMVTDAGGNPVVGVSVVFSAPSSGATGTFAGGLSSVTVITKGDGTATAPTFTANNTTGTYLVGAAASPIASGNTSVGFSLGNYTRFNKVLGDGQKTAPNTAFGASLKVLALDPNAKPMPGVTVTFSIVAGTGGASAGFNTGSNPFVAATGADGTVTTPTLNANGNAGAFSVTATASGLPTQTFTLMIVTNPFSYGGGQTGATTRTLQQPFIVQASSQATAGTMVFRVVPDANTGAGGSFNGAPSVTVGLDAQRYGTSPQLTANGNAGVFTVTADDGVTTAIAAVTTTSCLNPGNTPVIVSMAAESALDNAVNNACAASTVDLTHLTGTINLTNRLRIDDNLNIVGPGASLLALDGGYMAGTTTFPTQYSVPSYTGTRLFFIGGGTVSISGITLQNGLGQGGKSGYGGAAAGMGGAVFMNGGALTLAGVTLSGNHALGGSTDGGSAGNASFNVTPLFGGGGFGGDGGPNQPYISIGGQGGGGGDLFGVGGFLPGGTSPGSAAGPGGPGAGGAGALYDRNDNGGAGGFGGGGGFSRGQPASSGSGGFGGGGGSNTGQTGNVAGSGGFGGGTGGSLPTPNGSTPGGSGAGFGGAIFIRAGTLTLQNDRFLNNSALGGTINNNSQSGPAIQGQGKGGALFIYNGAVVVDYGSVFVAGPSANVAPDAGSPGIGNSAAPYTNGSTCPGQDTVDICGNLTLGAPAVQFTGPASAVYGSQFAVTTSSTSGASATISVVGGSCRVSGAAVTMTAGTGKCQLLATWPAASGYSGTTATLSVSATPIEVTVSVTAADKIFDGTTAATITSCSPSGVLPSDKANVTCGATGATFALAGADRNIPVTATGITLGGSAASNYYLFATTAATTAGIAFPSAGSCSVAPAGITAWLKAEGNTNDAAGLNNATPGGNLSYAAGQVGQAFSFDGSQSPFVALPAGTFPAEPGAGPFTFETWFKTSGGGVILGQQDVSPYGANPSGWVLAVYVGTDGYLYAQMFSSVSGIAPLESAIMVRDSQWHHVAVTYDGATETAYLDGAPMGRTALTQKAYPGPFIYQLGTGFTAGWPGGLSGWYTFNGIIDETTVYSRALGAGEVTAIAQAGPYGKCNPGASLNHSALSFTNVAVGQNATQTAVLSNQGNAPLQISSIATDPGDNSFTVLAGAAGDCAPGTPVQPGAACNVRVQFAPRTGSQLSGSVNVTDNSAYLGGTQTIALSGSLATVSVTVGTSPAGLSVSAGGSPVTGPLQWNAGQQYTLTTTSPQPGPAGTQYVFSNWSDGVTSISDTVTASTATTGYIANFGTQYYLMVNASPAGAAQSLTASGYYNAGSTVSLSATAQPGYVFAGWSSNVSNNAIYMNGPKTVTANFVLTPSNTCSSAPSGLNAWWKGEGDALDVKGAFNAARGGDVGFAAGKVGQAFSFDGTQSPFVSLPASVFPFPGASPFSFETWFETAQGGAILGQQGGAGAYGAASGNVPAVYVGTDGKLYAEAFWSGQFNPIVSTGGVNDGAFHHVAVTYDGANETVYLDGVNIGSQPLTQTPYNSAGYSYQLGTAAAGSQWPGTVSGWFTFNGLIDEASVYTKALSQNEVLNIVAAGSAGKCSVPITIQTVPAAAVVTVDGNPYTGSKGFNWIAGDTHALAATTVTGAGTRTAFSSWSDGGAASHGYTVPANSATVTATFATSYLLTLAQSTGGTISAVTASPTGDGYYLSGTAVTLGESPAPGYVFSNWSSNAPNGLVTMTASQTVSAAFLKSQTITFNPIATQLLGSGPLTLSATASSGLPVAYTSQSAAVCSVSGNSVTLLATGHCIVQAAQAGGSGYAAAQPGSQTFAIAANVTSMVSVTAGGLIYNRVAKTGTETFTIKNIGATPIAGPMELALTINGSGVTPAGNSGTFGGNPYWTAMANGSLAPGASITVSVTFGYGAGINFTTTPAVYSGGLN